MRTCVHTYIHTLHYITLHYITLPYVTLHCIALHYIALHYITLHYITLHTYIHTYIHYIHYIHTYIHYITLHYITLHYITLHYITLHNIHTYVHTQCMYVYIYICVCTFRPLGRNYSRLGSSMRPVMFDKQAIGVSHPAIDHAVPCLQHFNLDVPCPVCGWDLLAGLPLKTQCNPQIWVGTWRETILGTCSFWFHAAFTANTIQHTLLDLLGFPSGHLSWPKG